MKHPRTPPRPFATLRDPLRGGPEPTSATSVGSARATTTSSSERGGTLNSPTLASAVDADLLARDFAVSVLDGDYLVLASSTWRRRGHRRRPGRRGAAAARTDDARAAHPPETVAETEAARRARTAPRLSLARARWRTRRRRRLVARRWHRRRRTRVPVPESSRFTSCGSATGCATDASSGTITFGYAAARRCPAEGIRGRHAPLRPLLRWQAFRLIRVSGERERGRRERPGRRPPRTVPRRPETFRRRDEWEETAAFSDASSVGAARTGRRGSAAQDAVERRWLASKRWSFRARAGGRRRATATATTMERHDRR